MTSEQQVRDGREEETCRDGEQHDQGDVLVPAGAGGGMGLRLGHGGGLVGRRG